jgi:hypothetical protein
MTHAPAIDAVEAAFRNVRREFAAESSVTRALMETVLSKEAALADFVRYRIKSARQELTSSSKAN